MDKIESGTAASQLLCEGVRVFHVTPDDFTSLVAGPLTIVEFSRIACDATNSVSRLEKARRKPTTNVPGRSRQQDAGRFVRGFRGGQVFLG